MLSAFLRSIRDLREDAVVAVLARRKMVKDLAMARLTRNRRQFKIISFFLLMCNQILTRCDQTKESRQKQQSLALFLYFSDIIFQKLIALQTICYITHES